MDNTTSPEDEGVVKEKEDAERAALQKEVEELEKEKQVRRHECMQERGFNPPFSTGIGRSYCWIDCSDRRFERAHSQEQSKGGLVMEMVHYMTGHYF